LHLRGYKSFAVAVPALAVAAAALTGCGGGGGGKPSGPTVAVGDTLRTYQTGDAWTYKVDGWEYRSGSPNLYVTSGSYVLGVQNDGTTGDKSFSHDLRVKWNDNTSLTENWLEDFEQLGGEVWRRGDTLDNPNFGTAGNFEVADNVTPKYLTDDKGNKILDQNGKPTIIGIESYEAQPELPASWSATTGLSSDDSYEIAFGNADGSATIKVTNHIHYGLTVVGKETVTVPAGTFQTWKTNMITGYQAQGRTVNATAWWAPQLGSYVKMDTTETTTTGQQVLHYVLQSTTVAF